MLSSADRHFIVVRGEARCLMCEKEAPCCTDVQVEKAAPTLSGPVGDSVSCVLGVDAVVLGDGGVSSGAVGRYLSVGDVSCGGDMKLCGVDTVVAGTVSSGLCGLERVSGGGDNDVSGVDTLVSGAFQWMYVYLDSVSPDAILVRVGEMPLSGGGDAVVSGIDEPGCGVRSVMTAGEFDVCACDN